MKKISLLTAFAFIICAGAFAQASFGVQIGGNVGFLQTERGNVDDYTNKPRIGLLAGFLAEIPMGPVSFRPEVNFVQKGGRNETTTNSGGFYTITNDKIRLNYVEVPLNFVYNLGDANRVFFGLGPNFGLGLSGKQEFEDRTNLGGTAIVSEGKRDVKFSGDNAAPGTLYLKRFDLGANALVGFRSSMGLTFSLGYTLGLTDIARNTANVSVKNHAAQLKVGYMFGGNGGSRTTTPTPASTGSMINF